MYGFCLVTVATKMGAAKLEGSVTNSQYRNAVASGPSHAINRIDDQTLPRFGTDSLLDHSEVELLLVNCRIAANVDWSEVILNLDQHVAFT